MSIKQCKMSETIEESLKIVRENTQNEKQSLKIEQELVFQIINSISEAQYQVQQLREQFEKVENSLKDKYDKCMKIWIEMARRESKGSENRQTDNKKNEN